MQRERSVCASCGAHFQSDDFTEELGELTTCPYCGSLEIELLTEEPEASDKQADAA